MKYLLQVDTADIARLEASIDTNKRNKVLAMWLSMSKRLRRREAASLFSKYILGKSQ
jgi:hypothetical protein